MVITSLNNDKIKELVKLKDKKYRDKMGLFFIEGYDIVIEAYKNKLIKDDAIKNSMVLAIYNVAGEIWQISNQIRKDRNEAEKNAAEKEILT